MCKIYGYVSNILPYGNVIKKVAVFRDICFYFLFHNGLVSLYIDRNGLYSQQVFVSLEMECNN